MPKTFIYFFALLFSLFSFSTKQTEEDLIMLEYVINQNKEVKDSTVLKQNFETLKEKSNTYIAKNLNVIYHVYLAQIYSDLSDKINPKSNQLFSIANQSAKELNNEALLIWVNTKFGFYYYNYSQYLKAFPHFMYASKLIDAVNPQQIIQKSDVYKTNAYFFGNVGNVEKSKNYLKNALEYTSKTNKDYGNILNAIGTIYYDNNDFVNAEHYYKLTMNAALKNNDKLRYAKALGDISLIYCHKKEFDKAIEALQNDIKISEELQEYRNIMFANIRLGKIYIEQNNITEGKKIMEDAKQYALTKSYLKSYENEINVVLLDIAIKENNTTEELKLRRQISDIEKHLAKTDGKDVINQINWDIQKKNFDYKFEAQNSKVEKQTLQKNALILVSLLLLLLIIFIFILFKRKIKITHSDYENKVLDLELKKLKSENLLSKTTQSLDDYKIYLTEKNRQIEVLNNELQTIHKSTVFSLEKERGKLHKLLHSHLMTDENWNNFKTVFIFEQKEFCENLNTKFPNLTDSNLRIIFLQKLGLSNVETAHILGITSDAVKKAKQRLKKKYDYFEEFLSEN